MSTVAQAGFGPQVERPSFAVRWIDGRVYPAGLWRAYALTFFASTLCCTVTLKLGEIQYLECIFALDFIAMVLVLLIQRPHLPVFKPFLQIAESYGLFLAATLILSFVALQQGFSISHPTLLKTPVILTVARIGEFFLDAFYMLYLAALFRTQPRLCRFGALTYLWTGIAGCLYSFITYPINVVYHLDLGTYFDNHRMRGFNNEGGGFGVYLISTITLAIVLYRRQLISRRLLTFSLLCMSGGLIGSASKSAFFALGMLGIITIGWLATGVRRWALFGVLGVALVVMGFLVDVPGQIEVYRQASARYQELSNLKWGDGNYVGGRVAGAVLAPRMFMAHPIAGIGWGNYPLVRDNPEYRQGSAFALSNIDAPSLGVFDYIVELGVPLWLYLVWIQVKPILMLKRAGADVWLISLALVHPVSNWAGAHLNLIHPWIVLAFALGLGYRKVSSNDFAGASPHPLLMP